MKDYISEADRNFAEEVDFLRKLVQCPSEAPAAFVNAGGEVCTPDRELRGALGLMLQGGEDLGFLSSGPAERAGHLEWKGGGDGILGIIGHLGPVTAGEDRRRGPCSADMEEGLCGCEITDGRGPVVAALFAMKALKDAGHMPACGIRLMFDCAEGGAEDGGDREALRRYIEERGPVDFGFALDGDFPVVNGEKGLIRFDIAKKFDRRAQNTGLELRSIRGGTAPDLVPSACRAVISAADEKTYDRVRDLAGDFRREAADREPARSIGLRRLGRSMEIVAGGRTAHAACPQRGVNAISVMMDFLGRLNFVNEDVNDFIAFYNENIGYATDGAPMGIALSDEASGPLTFNAGMIEYDRRSLAIGCDLRLPVSFGEEDVYGRIAKVTDRYDMGIHKLGYLAPVYPQPESPLIRELLGAYREITGDRERGPVVAGCPTSAGMMEHFAACGGRFPDDADLKHGGRFPGDADLKRSGGGVPGTESLRQMTKIYAEALYRLTSPGFELLKDDENI